jgi:mono/diheme cytochrome c family protein
MRSMYAGGLLLVASITFVLVGMAGAQSPENPGAGSLYVRYCADCHGMSGRGDGSAAATLKPPPSDLTRSTLSRDELIRVIDGRRPLNAHGAPSMPKWGSLFESQGGMAGQRTSEIRIGALADWVLRLREADPTPKSPAVSEPR